MTNPRHRHLCASFPEKHTHPFWHGFSFRNPRFSAQIRLSSARSRQHVVEHDLPKPFHLHQQKGFRLQWFHSRFGPRLREGFRQRNDWTAPFPEAGPFLLDLLRQTAIHCFPQHLAALPSQAVMSVVREQLQSGTQYPPLEGCPGPSFHLHWILAFSPTLLLGWCAVEPDMDPVTRSVGPTEALLRSLKWS